MDSATIDRYQRLLDRVLRDGDSETRNHVCSVLTEASQRLDSSAGHKRLAETAAEETDSSKRARVTVSEASATDRDMDDLAMVHPVAAATQQDDVAVAAAAAPRKLIDNLIGAQPPEMQVLYNRYLRQATMLRGSGIATSLLSRPTVTKHIQQMIHDGATARVVEERIVALLARVVQPTRMRVLAGGGLVPGFVSH